MRNEINTLGVKTLLKKFFKKLWSWVIIGIWFILSIWIFIIVYAAWRSVMTPVWTWSGLTASSWNQMIDNLNDLNSRVSNFTFSSWKVWIWAIPTDTFTINWWITATSFTSSTARTLIPSNWTWTSSMYCRRIWDFLQFKWSFSVTAGTNASWWPVSTFPNLPAECYPSYIIWYISWICRSSTSISSSCLVRISTTWAITMYDNSLFYATSFAWIYPAN
jgi:hypothetical protein